VLAFGEKDAVGLVDEHELCGVEIAGGLDELC